MIGAGPGDPELITVKGKEILKKADCVIYDRLIPQELLDETKAGCECIYVGKENHHHTMKQEQINELLAQKALQYDIVVRLKGGDPFVFGRGGEEDGIHTLQEWYEPKEAWLGPQRDLLLMILLAGAEGVCEPAIEKR